MSKRKNELNIIFNELEKIYKRELDEKSDTDGVWKHYKGVIDEDITFSWKPRSAKSIDEIKEFTIIESKKTEFVRK